jgi:hypothetical protein
MKKKTHEQLHSSTQNKSEIAYSQFGRISVKNLIAFSLIPLRLRQLNKENKFGNAVLKTKVLQQAQRTTVNGPRTSVTAGDRLHQNSTDNSAY